MRAIYKLWLGLMTAESHVDICMYTMTVFFVHFTIIQMRSNNVILIISLPVAACVDIATIMASGNSMA